MRILILVVAASVLSACTANQDKTSTADNSRRAIGVETKTGQSLTAKELCSELKTDASGQSTVDTLQFNRNSSYVKRTLMIDKQVQFVPVSTTKGHWGLLNDSILFNDKGILTTKSIKSVDSSGGTTCFQIGTGAELQNYCPCN